MASTCSCGTGPAMVGEIWTGALNWALNNESKRKSSICAGSMTGTLDVSFLLQV